MNKKKGLTIVLVVSLVLVLLCGIFAFVSNKKLNDKKDEIKEELQSVKLVYKEKTESITPLLNLISSNTKRSEEYISAVTSATKELASALETDEFDAIHDKNVKFEEALASLNKFLDRYPLLKTSEEYKKISADFDTLREKIDKEEYKYNNLVYDYNNILSVFPNNVLSLIFGHEKCEMI